MKSASKIFSCLCVLLASQTTSVSANDVGNTGHATVMRGDDHYEFVVIQCLRNVSSPLSGRVIEFQLDGVPAGTPAETVQRLLGVIEQGDNVTAELMPVVQYGPILSFTRLQDGGEQLAVTDLGDIMWTSDGSPLDAASRALDVTADESVPKVSGTTSSDGGTVTVDAVCPGEAATGND